MKDSISSDDETDETAKMSKSDDGINSISNHQEDKKDNQENNCVEEEFDGDEESDDDSDDDNDGEDDEETEIDDESSTDGETESDRENISILDESPLSPNSTPTCYICLNNFEGQDIGSPDSCENMHYFCLECIEEWSKQINTCPVDRKSFSFILVRRIINGEIVMKVPIAKKSVLEIVTLDDDVTYCEICGRCDREDRLLLCDGCDFGYHCECLSPPLETIPVDEWFCPDCFERLYGEDAHEENNRRQVMAQRRALARTGAFERVRNRILARRSNSSSGSTQRRKTKRKTRRRKTKKRKTTKTKSSTKSKKPRRRRYKKRRTKKSKLSMKKLPAADPRSRLATRLGLVCKPKSPFGLPVTKATANINKSLSEIRYSAGISNLSLFGYELDVNDVRSYGDDLDVESNIGSVGLLTNTRHHIFPIVNRKIKSPEPLLQISGNDVLSEIMNSQEILHASSSDLSVARDGRVYRNPISKSNQNNVKQCPNSNNSSPPSNNGNNHSSSNNSNIKNNYTTYENSSSYSSENAQENISFIKPSPVVSLLDDKNDFEMYSDIESLGDNKDIDDNQDDENSKKIKKENKPLDENKNEKDSDLSISNNLKSNLNETKSSIKTNEEPNSIISPKKSAVKRRPSIKDLFGGDSEDDDDEGEKLKQLVATQGSINVHFPIKMPIVLKSNILSQKKSEVDEVSIAKKWVPLYPEINSSANKKSGSKWKAIGEDEEKKEKPSMNNNSKNANRIKDSDDAKNIKEKENNKKEFKLDIEEFKIREDEIDKNEDIFPEIAITNKLLDKSKDKELDKNLDRNSPKKSSTDKVRTCKHGRPLNKTKEKDSEKKRLLDTTISSISEMSSSKKSKIEINKTSNLNDKNDESDWSKKKPANKSNDYRSQRDDMIDNHRYNKNDRKFSSKSDSTRKKSDEDSKYEHRQNRKRFDDDYYYYEKPSILSRLEMKTSSRSDEYTKPKVSYEKYSFKSSHQSSSRSDNRSSLKETSSSSKHYHHRHHHHHHHHRHKTSNNSESSRSSHPSTSMPTNNFESKPKNLYQSYPNMQLLDSKEIFAEGDKIIINVNFKKEEPKANVEDQKKPEFDEKVESRINVISPETSDSLDDSIASPNEDEFENSSFEKIKKAMSSIEIKNVLSEELKFLPRILPNNDNSNSSKILMTRSESKSPDDLFIDNDSFLPTPTQDESQSPILSTGRANNDINKPQSKINDIFTMTNSNNTTTENAQDEDFYDPELPLQSPDHDSIKSPREKIDFDSPSMKSPLMSISSKSAKESSSGNSKLTSLNSINFNQIFQLAQTLNSGQNSLSTNLTNVGSVSGSISSVKHGSLPKTNVSAKETNNDIIEIVDMDVDSPTSLSPTKPSSENYSSSLANVKEIWDQIVKTATSRLENSTSKILAQTIDNGSLMESKSKSSKFDFLDSQQPPTSAVDMEIKEKYLKKLNRQERVVEEVKLALKPYYKKKKINKDQYKDILRKAVPKICHSKSGEINPSKILRLVEAYIKHVRHQRKK